MGKGFITPEMTVFCGGCMDWVRTEKGGHTRVWRKRGWKFTRAHGWQCPACSEKMSKEK